MASLAIFIYKTNICADNTDKNSVYLFTATCFRGTGLFSGILCAKSPKFTKIYDNMENNTVAPAAKLKKKSGYRKMRLKFYKLQK